MMDKKIKIILFANDSYFAYLLAKPVIDRFHNNIAAIVFSSMIKGSLSHIISIYKKTYMSYFLYRSFIDIISRFNSFLNCKTIQSLAKKYDLKTFTVENVNKTTVLENILPCTLGLTFNFDKIIKEKLLASFEKGVINVHASRLPDDKGISPVLWAFARGDRTVWSTIYSMDKGIDTGLIYKQLEIPVKNCDTAFSLYERVCRISGHELSNVVDLSVKGWVDPLSQSRENEGNYWSWPDKRHKKMMKASKRHFINFSDVLRLLQKDKT